MADLVVYETGNGGDIKLKGNDLALTDGLTNMPYLALFGGNPEANTAPGRLPNEQAFDWWGNSILFPNDESIQFNSNFERALGEVSLTSSGRIILEGKIKKDLAFMGKSEFAEVTVSTSVLSVDRIEFTIKVQEPGNPQDREFIYIWDATKNELIEINTI